MNNTAVFENYLNIDAQAWQLQQYSNVKRMEMIQQTGTAE